MAIAQLESYSAVNLFGIGYKQMKYSEPSQKTQDKTCKKSKQSAKKACKNGVNMV